MGGAALVLALGLVLGLGIYLVREQNQATDQLKTDFAGRAHLTAKLFGDTLRSSEDDVQQVASTLADANGAPPTASSLRQMGVNGLIVLNAEGDVLTVRPANLKTDASAYGASTGFAKAVNSGQAVWHSIVQTSAGYSAVVYAPVKAAAGLRVVVLLLPVQQVSTLGRAYLSTLDVLGGDTYIVDEAGRVIVASNGAPVDRPVPDAALASALSQATDQASAGSFGDHYFAASNIPVSHWRVVFVTTERALQEPLSSSRRVAWQLFGAFAGAMALIVVIGGTSLRRSARLAHARRHDALTGLPNRSLMVEQMDRALHDRGPHPVAAIFIDLDGFKPVNDTYGHAVGDALLQAVSGRLNESLRPGDSVSRFGGDEFLVLGRNLRSPADAVAVAERIQQYLAGPFEIDGHVLLIGSSIGVAVSDPAGIGAAALIRQADLAMYRAKQAGRGRIELAEPARAAEGV